MSFYGWLDTRALAFPGDPERTCDTVAAFADTSDAAHWWALTLEFQTRPDAELFGRFLEYLGRLWRELRPRGQPQTRFEVGAAIVNLTGNGRTARDIVLGGTGLRTCLSVVERNLSDEDAAEALAQIAGGRVARCLLPFIPLMRGGRGGSIIGRWQELAHAEPDMRRRADYGGLALVFAELSDCRQAWKEALEGWNVEQSVQVLEWQAEAKAQGKAETKAEDVLHALRKRLSAELPADVEQAIRSTSDLDELNRWFDHALTASTMAAFRRLSGLKAPNGSGRPRSKSARSGSRRKRQR